jgi:hypothetical protein
VTNALFQVVPPCRATARPHCAPASDKHLLDFVSFILYQFQFLRGCFAFRCCLQICSFLVLRLKSKSHISATNLCSNFQTATQTSVDIRGLATLNYTLEPCRSISTSTRRFGMWNRMGHCNQSNCICFVFFERTACNEFIMGITCQPVNFFPKQQNGLR